MSSKSTNMIENRDELKAELELLKLRIEGKIRKIVFTQKKLPFERLAKGRRIKEVVILALGALDKGDDLKVQECLRELREMGIEVKGSQ